MKKIIFLLFVNISAFAQWNGATSSTDYNNNIHRIGAVGIGGTPQAALHIQGGMPVIALSDNDDPASPVGTAGNPHWLVRSYSTGTFQIRHTTDFVSFIERFAINTSGTAFFTGQDAKFYSNTSGNTVSIGRGTNEKFNIQVDDFNGFLDYYQDADEDQQHIFYIRNLAQGTSPNNDIRFQTANADRLVIKASGRVGIGNNSPSHALSIESSSQNVLSVKSSSHSVVDIESGNGLNSYLRFKNNGANKWDLTSETNGNLRIYDYLGATTRLVITPQGLVGIGTTTPDQKLTVDGVVKCEEVRVEVFTGTGPDYVFAPDYNLLPLSEVESYIKANKHLPEVPSAKQMEEEGLRLKEMNLLLLKKVEELTLHLIALDKKNSEIQLENTQLKSQATQVDKMKLEIAEIKALLLDITSKK